MTFKRIIHTANYFPDRAFFDEPYLMHLAYSFAQSKIGTSLFVEGKSDWDVVDDEPDPGDEVFCTVIIPLAELYIEFDDAQDLERYLGMTYYSLTKGDIMVFTGMTPSKIELTKELNPSFDKDFLSYPYEVRKFKMQKKVAKGNGKNKYKVSITFSDTYEIEVMGDSPEDAKRTAMGLGFHHWDHIYDATPENWQEFKHQKVRYTTWRDSDIVVDEILTTPDQ